MNEGHKDTRTQGHKDTRTQGHKDTSYASSIKIKERQKGFTLVELIVVIVILGILAATAMPKYLNMRREARIAALTALEGSLRTAVQESQLLYLAAPERITFSNPSNKSGHLQINDQTRIQVVAEAMTTLDFKKTLGAPLNNYAGIGKLMGMSPEIRQLPNATGSPASKWYGMAQGFMMAGLLDPTTNDLENPEYVSANGSYWFPPDIKPEDVTAMNSYASATNAYALSPTYDGNDAEIHPQCFVYYRPLVSLLSQNPRGYHIFSRTSEC